jgi:hypothetical protein
MRTMSHSLCTVIPSHILRHVAEHGDAEDRALIEATAAQTEQLREERQTPNAFRDGADGSSCAIRRRAILARRHAPSDAFSLPPSGARRAVRRPRRGLER